ncbi:hypothetical protein AB1Y20_022489 [Prymnesium parvum]|uniref:CRAL-TRIO domain-containing protein n=1 Tax=Prymnesium parvum TaxID=97485 RepID=A0AB34JJR5_PRYPA
MAKVDNGRLAVLRARYGDAHTATASGRKPTPYPASASPPSRDRSPPGPTGPRAGVAHADVPSVVRPEGSPPLGSAKAPSLLAAPPAVGRGAESTSLAEAAAVTHVTSEDVEGTHATSADMPAVTHMTTADVAETGISLNDGTWQPAEATAAAVFPDGVAAEVRRLAASVPPATMAAMRERFPHAREVDWLRFLKASGGDLRRGGDAYEQHVRWKASLPADIKAAAWTEIAKGKFYQRGVARTGAPVCYWQTSKNDPKTRDLQACLHAAIFWCFHVEQLLDSRGADEERSFVMVIDRWHNVLDLQLLLAAVPIMQANFPERLNAIYVVPTNGFLRGLYRMVHPLLNEETRRLVKLLSSFQDLHSFIDTDQLPARMGGTDLWEFNPECDVPDLHIPAGPEMPPKQL